MFVCLDCGRAYANQNSLTRHKHNHDKTKQHICAVCDVVFFRRDLLSRHAKMHEAAPGERSSNEAEGLVSPKTSGARKRCHTACDACRAAKTKCDGYQPCETCKGLGSLCVYSANKKRISETTGRPDETNDREIEPVAKRTQPTFLETESHLDHMGATDVALPSFYNAKFPVPALYSRLFDYGSGQPPRAVPVADSLCLGESAIPDDSDLLSPGTSRESNFWNATTSWPWLHEDMFLTSEAPSWIDANDYTFDFSHDASVDAIVAHTINDLSNQAGLLLPLLETIECSTTGMPDATPSARARNPYEKNQLPVNSETPEVSPFMDRSSLQISPRLGARSERVGTSEIAIKNPRKSFEKTLLAGPRTAAQLRLVEELGVYALSPSVITESKRARDTYWRSMSIRVQEVFGFNDEPTTNNHGHKFEDFVGLWSQHFEPLWPLLPRWNFDCNSLHPVLYLTLVSIGAMYSDSRQSHFATLLHEQIRKTLLTTAIEFEESDSEEDYLWLAQARSLTQVAALYFGQRKAFSYAQHLGGALVAQSRRMNLFSAQPDVFLQAEAEDERMVEPERVLKKWLNLESRKRLAFGMLRAEAYTSILLSSRPLVSSDELDLEFPCSESLWRRDFGTAADYLVAIKKERKADPLSFVELQRIVMDREEPIPVLEPLGYELSIFGIQEAVWRVCHDRTLSKRLKGNMSAASHRSRYTCPQTLDPLAVPARKMKDLRLQKDRMLHAMQKWKRSFDTWRAQNQLQKDRNSILSSLLLYHISYLCLHAPVEDLHRVSYRLGSSRPLEQSLLGDMRTWTQTQSAHLATEQACRIWSIIFHESQRSKNSRAKFNFLAFLGLHHAAAVIWAYANTHESATIDTQGNPLELEAMSFATEPLNICRKHVQELMKRFVFLYGAISPARWSSFATAAVKLSQNQGPLPPS